MLGKNIHELIVFVCSLFYIHYNKHVTQKFRTMFIYALPQIVL